MLATAKDLRLHSRELLSAVERGEEVVISFHGKPLARLVALEAAPKGKTAKHSAGFGMWKDRADMKDVDAYVGRLREGRKF